MDHACLDSCSHAHCFLYWMCEGNVTDRQFFGDIEVLEIAEYQSSALRELYKNLTQSIFSCNGGHIGLKAALEVPDDQI